MQRELVRTLIVSLLLALPLLGIPGQPALAAPDEPYRHPVHAVAGQRLHVTTPAGSGALRLYLSQDWAQPLPEVTRAVIVIHGRLRNAETYFRSAQAAQAAAGPAGRGTLLVVPQFLADVDLPAHHLPPETLHWSFTGWMAGHAAHAPAPLSSFDALDAILARLADRTRFPHLRQVVLAGHSGGGQVVQRYAIVGRGEAALRRAGIGMRYVVANPSSYAYFSAERPAPGGGFAPFAASACPGFNRWKYGLEHLPAYAEEAPPAALEQAYVRRPVVYLLGLLDTDPHHPALDTSCAAEAQGAFRLARGQAYFRYLRGRHRHLAQRVVEVPGVDHDGDAMLTSPCGLAALFDVPGCPALPPSPATAAPRAGSGAQAGPG